MSDDESSVGYESSVGTGSNKMSDSEHGDKNGTDPQNNIAQRESVIVRWSKGLVLIVLVIVAAILSTTTFLFTRSEAQGAFKQEFYANANELTRSASEQAENMFGQLLSLSHTISTFTMSAALESSSDINNNKTWPFFEFPYFEKHAEDSALLAGFEVIMFAPIVKPNQKAEWEAFAREQLVNHGLEVSSTAQIQPFDSNVDLGIELNSHQIQDDEVPDASTATTATYAAIDSPFDNAYIPVWQYGTLAGTSAIFMRDLTTIKIMDALFQRAHSSKTSLMSMELNTTVFTQAILGRSYFDEDDVLNNVHVSKQTDVNGVIIQPVFSVIDDEESEVVGFLIGVLSWHTILYNALPVDSGSVFVDVRDTCDSHFHFMVNGSASTFMENEERIGKFEHMTLSNYLTMGHSKFHLDTLCRYELTVHPTIEMEEQYVDNKPVLYTVTVLLIFLFAIGVFVAYDRAVYVRQRMVMNAAIRSNAVVSSLFPKQVRQRLMNDVGISNITKITNKKGGFNKDGTHDNEDEGGSPIADLFPEASVLFADIAGFTAWSSTREPSQVFTLLETVYAEFDAIAKQRRVFKVETVGDCFVGVCGLPEPCRQHALMMARFANDCLLKMGILTKQLEVELGPDTGDLGLRVGIHSGPVTAGVLRGERARFQLFGDTVNTAARMESTGSRNQIQVSQETAELLIAAGKSHWLKARQAPVYAKGKGELQTYWLEVKNHESATEKSSENTETKPEPLDYIKAHEEKQKKKGEMLEKQRRLIDWNTDILQRYLNDIIKRREVMNIKGDPEPILMAYEDKILQGSGIVLDEVSEVINLPRYTAEIIGKINANKNSTTGVSKAASDQLKAYVATIAELYRGNAFHNFEHASHVTMSVVKLLSRIVAPDLKDLDNTATNDLSKCLHDYTYGITSDPLTQFSVIFSALIHDVDHTGVPNNQLVKEQCSIAMVYQNKSVAEQNSVDIAWNLLMEKEYKDLRRAIYTNRMKLMRFRQLLVNTVLATDIMDKDLKELRNARWNKAFAEETSTGGGNSNSALDQDRKATIVIEHLIQASDVAHTMQHWHIYRKWNARLFEEMYTAYLQGRADTNPADNWYQGEIGFFDHYIIPLAMKLRSCGVFGVSSDEYLNYARQNRQEWERKGKQVVAELVESLPSATTRKSAST